MDYQFCRIKEVLCNNDELIAEVSDLRSVINFLRKENFELHKEEETVTLELSNQNSRMSKLEILMDAQIINDMKKDHQVRKFSESCLALVQICRMILSKKKYANQQS